MTMGQDIMMQHWEDLRQWIRWRESIMNGAHIHTEKITRLIGLIRMVKMII